MSQQQDIEMLNEHQLDQHEELELNKLEGTIERGIKVFLEVGEALFAIRDKRLYRATHATFDTYCHDRWQMSKTQANRLIGAADVAKDLTPMGVIPSSERVARPLVSLPTEQRQNAWQQAVESAPNGKPTAAHVSRAVREIGNHVSVDQETAALGESLGLPSHGDSVLPESDRIDDLTHTSVADIEDQEHYHPESEQTLAPIEEIHLEDGRKLFISHSPGIKKFNRTNDMVDWAWWTWNPVTGCWHGCDYCYARDIANRFFDTKFEPTFYPDRLSAPANTRLPNEAATDIRAKNVFVSSMGDLFGKWVPDEWILRVFEVVINNAQWNFLFLTKFPQRLQEICDKLGGFPDNAWVGTTVDTQARVKVAEKAFKNIDAKVKWLSCEPLLEHLSFTSLEMFDWVVIGGQSKSTQTPEFQPQIEWVSDLFLKARSAGCKVYRKENLIVDFPKELPW